MKNPCCEPCAKCIDTRPREHCRVRRYVCLQCGQRWTTLEVVAEEQDGLTWDDIACAMLGALEVFHKMRRAVPGRGAKKEAR